MYVVIVLLFGGALLYIIKVHSDNNELISSIAGTQNSLDEAKRTLQSKDQDLARINSELSGDRVKLGDLDNKMKNLEAELAASNAARDKFDENSKQCYLDSMLAQANVYGLIAKLGIPLKQSELARIQLAEANLEGKDGDGDGLSDLIEGALLTDPAKADTDGDGYGDKDEMLRGFNPLGAGNLPIERSFSKRYVNQIVLPSDSGEGAWYVGADLKKYFLGVREDGYQLMKQLGYWTKEYMNMIAPASSTLGNAGTGPAATAAE